MVKTRRGLISLSMFGLAAVVFAYAAAATSVSAQTKVQLRAQFAKTVTKLPDMAWNSSCSADINAMCHAVKPGAGRVYNCLVRNKARLTKGCIKTLPKAKPLVAQLAQIRSKLAAAQDKKPNIVVVMTDNQGYGDLGAYGGLRAPTPRIDRLASEGVRFLDFQVEPNCTPSRAAFMTGRMPIRSGTSGLVFPGELGGLHPMEVTLGELMKTAGYATAYYGKWHLGETPEREPQMQGFDEFYGILNTSFPVNPNFPGTDLNVIPSQKVLRGIAGQPAKVVREMSIDYRALVDRDLSEMSAKYIKEKTAAGKPFFLMTSYINPHHPVIPHPDFKGKSGGGAYSDTLMEIDHNTGIILDAIAKAGIRDNTIVIWLSDNGPTRYSLAPDQNGDPGPWSGELGSTWEGGLRTIGMVRWPGRIRKD